MPPVEPLESRELLSASAVTAVNPPVDGQAPPSPAYAAHAPADANGRDARQVVATAGQPGYFARRTTPGDFTASYATSVRGPAQVQQAPAQAAPFLVIDRATGTLAVVYMVPAWPDRVEPALNRVRDVNLPAPVIASTPAQVQSVAAAVPPRAEVVAGPQSLPREAKVAANAVADASPARLAASSPATATAAAAGAAPARAGGAFSSRLIASMEFVSNVLPGALAGAATAVAESKDAAAAAVSSSIVAAAVDAAPRLFHFAQINWANAFADAWGEIAEEGASLPLATVDGRARAWVITGAVATFDLVLASWYVSRRVGRKKAAKSQEIRVGLA